MAFTRESAGTGPVNLKIVPVTGAAFAGLPMYSHTYSKSMDQPGKVANPARDQLNMDKLMRAFPPPHQILVCTVMSTKGVENVVVFFRSAAQLCLTISILRISIFLSDTYTGATYTT